MSKTPTFENSVFINCPFDDDYAELQEAIIFTVMCLGFHPRSSMQIEDGGIRESKIIKIIGECRFGIHDVSRIEIDADTKMPRFNMPFELGVDTGCKEYGNKKQKSKCRLVLVNDVYNFDACLSDISGQDPKAHGNDPELLIKIVRNWLNNNSEGQGLPGPAKVRDYFENFKIRLPKLCSKLELEEDELQYKDYVNCVNAWLEEHQNPKTSK